MDDSKQDKLTKVGFTTVTIDELLGKTFFQFDDWKPCPLCQSKNLDIGVIDFSGYGVTCLDCGLRLRREMPWNAPIWLIERGLMFPDVIGRDLYQEHALKRVQLVWNHRKGATTLRNFAKGVARYLDCNWLKPDDELIEDVIWDVLREVLDLTEELLGTPCNHIWEH